MFTEHREKRDLTWNGTESITFGNPIHCLSLYMNFLVRLVTEKIAKHVFRYVKGCCAHLCFVWCHAICHDSLHQEATWILPYRHFFPSGQYKYYTFLEELSCDGCKEDDEVNIINMPLLSLIGGGQWYWYIGILQIMDQIIDIEWIL